MWLNVFSRDITRERICPGPGLGRMQRGVSADTPLRPPRAPSDAGRGLDVHYEKTLFVQSAERHPDSPRLQPIQLDFLSS